MSNENPTPDNGDENTQGEVPGNVSQGVGGLGNPDLTVTPGDAQPGDNTGENPDGGDGTPNTDGDPQPASPTEPNTPEDGPAKGEQTNAYPQQVGQAPPAEQNDNE